MCVKPIHPKLLMALANFMEDKALMLDEYE